MDSLRRCRIARKTAVAKPPTPAAAARSFAVEAARLAANTRCHSVVVLDVAGISPVCDYFVLATGTSSRQMKSVGEEIVELAQAQKFAPMSGPALDSETWILIDCFDVVVHLFSEEGRHYYDLDNLWGDAKKVEWQEKNAKK